ncbi:KilA-N domain-containing protein [Halomonas beimenensis]|uniref:KilA-N domain-containing protein n=1 Tax=Halomonas beimenensis TaxID=475662 RepID=A0A291P589_9GAMM|nr:KilA-N domain-containing protein [Halomonas beimenensis]ATJ82029.1 hypothetical protein BEI_1042 [Halomonas beimenensis]
MSKTQLITKQWNDKTLTFRQDGYFNMTKAAKQFGKRDALDFFRNAETQDYLAELEKTTGIPVDSLVIKTRGRHGGTWAHPKLAVFFARWLDTRFAVACDAMIEDILKGNAEVTVTKPQQSATMALPQDYLSALEQLTEAVRREQEKDKVIEEQGLAPV